MWFWSKERPRNDGEWHFLFRPREKWKESHFLPGGRGVGEVDSHSLFFAPKQHGNACYAGQQLCSVLLNGGNTACLGRDDCCPKVTWWEAFGIIWS